MSQQHTPSSNTIKGPEQNFTGDVYVNILKLPTDPSKVVAGLVRFTPGARSNWHHHALGQTLYVTEGVGLTGTRDGQVIKIRAGETVWCPAEEEHWHGATAETFMSHIAIVETNGNADGTTWLEPVTDEQYQTTPLND